MGGRGQGRGTGSWGHGLDQSHICAVPNHGVSLVWLKQTNTHTDKDSKLQTEKSTW